MTIFNFLRAYLLITPSVAKSFVKEINELYKVINRNISTTLKEHEKALKEYDIKLQVLNSKRLAELFNKKVKCP